MDSGTTNPVLASNCASVLRKRLLSPPATGDSTAENPRIPAREGAGFILFHPQPCPLMPGRSQEGGPGLRGTLAMMILLCTLLLPLSPLHGQCCSQYKHPTGTPPENGIVSLLKFNSISQRVCFKMPRSCSDIQFPGHCSCLLQGPHLTPEMTDATLQGQSA